MSDNTQLFVVIALIRNTSGQLLLQKRVDTVIPSANGKWEFPGGKVEYGEDPTDAIQRECLEEVGCKIKLGSLLPFIQSVVWPRMDGEEQHVLAACYEAEWVEGTPSPKDKKVSEVKWFSENDIAVIDTLKGIKEFIELSKKHNDRHKTTNS